MITGTAVSDLQGLGDEQSHADRYVRLGEFIALMRQLLASPRPATFEGRFYRASNLQLRPRLPPELMPEFLVAGQSEPAQRVAKETGCIKMQMLPPDLDRRLDAPGMNFGIFAREGRDEARQAAKARFRDNADDRELLVLTVEPLERIAFQLTGDRIDADLRLHAVDADRTEVTLTVSGPWLIGLNRRYAHRALARLYALLQPAAGDEP